MVGVIQYGDYGMIYSIVSFPTSTGFLQQLAASKQWGNILSCRSVDSVSSPSTDSSATLAKMAQTPNYTVEEFH